MKLNNKANCNQISFYLVTITEHGLSFLRWFYETFSMLSYNKPFCFCVLKEWLITPPTWLDIFSANTNPLPVMGFVSVKR
jgi:hypothetical protein